MLSPALPAASEALTFFPQWDSLVPFNSCFIKLFGLMTAATLVVLLGLFHETFAIVGQNGNLPVVLFTIGYVQVR